MDQQVYECTNECSNDLIYVIMPPDLFICFEIPYLCRMRL